jgi:cilia- and flagella-associated protein 57
MRISFDDSYLFTCGEDGCLWLYKIQDRGDTRGTKREKEWSFSDEVRMNELMK